MIASIDSQSVPGKHCYQIIKFNFHADTDITFYSLFITPRGSIQKYRN